MTATDLISFGSPAPEQKPVFTGPGHDRTPKERGFRGLLVACLAIGVVFLVVLLAYVLIEGWPRMDTDLFRNQASQLGLVARIRARFTRTPARLVVTYSRQRPA